MKRRTKWILYFLLGIACLCIMLSAYILVTDMLDRREPRTYYLGDPDWTGYIGVLITYDRTPVDVELISPSGNRFGNPKSILNGLRRASVYEINEKEKTIRVLVDTDEPGGWSVSFPRKSNSHIEYELITGISPTLYIHGGDRITSENGRYYLDFTASMLPAESDQFTYNVILNRDGRSNSILIDSGSGTLNKNTRVEIRLPLELYTGDIYNLRLTVILPFSGDDIARPTTAGTSFNVVLGASGTASDSEEIQPPPGGTTGDGQ